MSRDKMVHRRTTCSVAIHGSRCAWAQDKRDRYPRTTDNNHALYFEFTQSEQCLELRGPAPRGHR